MVRLVSVIGHGVNLLNHFIDHYKNYVDEMHFVIYETEKYPLLANEVKEIIGDNDKIKIVHVLKNRIFDWEEVTKLYNFVKSKKPNDWWVVADIDEFHLYPNDDLKTVISNCDDNGWEIVRGGFIDRIGRDGDFTELDASVENSIWCQYPNAGFFRYQMSNACPNKICVVKGNIELTPGQHYAKIDGQTTWKWQGWNHPLINNIDTVQVHHFKWDKTSIERSKEVASLKQDYAFSNEYSKLYTEIIKSKNRIDLRKSEYMFELDLNKPKFDEYKQWNKLINKIKSI